MRYFLGCLLLVVVATLIPGSWQRFTDPGDLRWHVHPGQRQVVVIGSLPAPDGTPVHYELAPVEPLPEVGLLPEGEPAAAVRVIRGTLSVRQDEVALQRFLPAGGAWRVRMFASIDGRSWERAQVVDLDGSTVVLDPAE
jgi:hypothetical protein